MDLLTDAQLRVINEFRDRVKQSEKRLRETIQSRENRDSFLNVSNNDISISNPDLSKVSDFKIDRNETPQRVFGINHGQEIRASPYLETGPQRLLKPVVFNGI